MNASFSSGMPIRKAVVLASASPPGSASDVSPPSIDAGALPNPASPPPLQVPLPPLATPPPPPLGCLAGSAIDMASAGSPLPSSRLIEAATLVAIAPSIAPSSAAESSEAEEARMRADACAVALSSCSADGGSSGSRRLDGKPPLALAEEREVLSEIPMAPGRWAAACGPLGLLPSCTGTMSNSCSSLGVAAAGASPCVAAEGAVAKAAPEAEEGAVPVTASCATPPVAIAGPVSAAESDQSADGSLPSAPLNPRCTGDAASTPGSTRSAVEAARSQNQPPIARVRTAGA